jgi:2,4-dienoyl-CoA reductase-like NADH-dependent reductase (Old Yellow Enzyme family)
VVAPSAIPFGDYYPMPRALTLEGIQSVVGAFAAAARRDREAGFRVIEIHAAHGYLLSEFPSPLANRRKDEYGGSLENRMRLLIELVRAVRGTWPESAPLFVRISATAWEEGGWTLDDSVALAKRLAVPNRLLACRMRAHCRNRTIHFRQALTFLRNRGVPPFDLTPWQDHL